jgi:DNA-binding NtrC family response regulator
MVPGSATQRAAEVAVPPMSLAAIIGESAPIQVLKRRARSLLDAEKRGGNHDLPPILISGETGTGKKLLAQALHFEGSRSDGPFVRVNCACVTPQRFEAEMFGLGTEASVQGGERKIGLVEAADGGTLFLDEIDELDLSCQTRLLKLLEEPILIQGDGGRHRRVDVRIIASTNQDLEGMVRNGSFRCDLYFRLCVVTLAMPPLRSMGDDIVRIAEFYLQRHGVRYGRTGLRLLAGAKARLKAYGWPGNARELRNKLEQTVLLAQGELIDAEQLGIAVAGSHVEAQASSGTMVAAHHGEDRAPEPGQKERLRQALEKTDWNVSRSARLLGLSRDIVRNRIKKFGFVRTYSSLENHVGEAFNDLCTLSTNPEAVFQE